MMRYVAALLIIFAIGVLPAASSATVLYQNNFDDKPDWTSPPEGTGGLAATHNDAKTVGFSEVHIGADKITGSGHEYFAISAAYARGSGKGLAVRVESEATRAWRGGRFCLHFADADNFDQSVINPNGYDELYISYWIKWDANWDWGGGLGNYFKIFRLYPDIDYNAVWNSSAHGGLSDHYNPDGSYKEGHVIIDWGGGPPYYLPNYCSEDDGDPVHCVTHNSADSSSLWHNYFNDNAWHHVSHRVKMNDIGQDNAITEVYIDGSLAGSNQTNFYIRKTNMLFNDIILFDNHYIACSSGSCPKEQTYYIDDIVISDAPLDKEPPLRSNGLPTSEQSSGTTQVTMSLTTDVAATCKYGNDGATGVDYASMANTFSTTGGTSHSTTITGLSDGNSYSRAVRCTADGTANDTDYVISWTVAAGAQATQITGTSPVIH